MFDKKYIVHEKDLRRANLLYFDKDQPYIKDGYDGVYITESSNYDKLKKDNAALQKALSTLTGMHSNLKEDNALLLEALRWITQIDRNPDNYLKLVQIAKDAIQKVKK